MLDMATKRKLQMTKNLRKAMPVQISSILLCSCFDMPNSKHPSGHIDLASRGCHRFWKVRIWVAVTGIVLAREHLGR